jgi:hypothetical protein
LQRLFAGRQKRTASLAHAALQFDERATGGAFIRGANENAIRLDP